MKLVKALMLVSALAVMPMSTLAVPPHDDFQDDHDDFQDDASPAVPEPSGALLMGAALATVALAVAARRKKP